MKIALVFPRFKYPSGDVPLGIGYMASFLRKHTSHEVVIIDPTFQKNPFSAIEKTLAEHRFDLVGLSIMTPMVRDAFRVAELAKQQNPNCRVIAGGPHPTILPEHTLSCASIDAVCIGEGEQTLLQFVESGDLANIPGLVLRNGNTIRCNPARAYIEDVDSLPFPAYDLYDVPNYLKAFSQMDVVSSRLRGFFIIGSRSCPFTCTYCQPTLQKIFGKRLRVHSPEYITDLLRHLKRRFGINSFFFADDTLNINRKWTYRLCEELQKARLNLLWGCNFRVDLIDYDSLKALKEVGLRKVNIGIESGSQRILDEIYEKKITLEQVRTAVETLRSLDMKIHGYFMIGTPTETLEEIRATLRFSRELDLDDAMFSITTPLPGTHLYDRTKELIGKDFEDYDYYKHSVYQHSSVLDETHLNRLRRRAVLGFYLRPKQLLRLLRESLSLAGMKKLYLKLKRF